MKNVLETKEHSFIHYNSGLLNIFIPIDDDCCDTTEETGCNKSTVSIKEINVTEEKLTTPKKKINVLLTEIFLPQKIDLSLYPFVPHQKRF